jgi:hypothetical protein
MYRNVFGEKVSKARYREMVNAAKNRRELIAAGLTSRRDLMKMGLLTAGGMLVAKSGLSARAYGQTQTNNPPSSGTNTSPGTNQNCVPGNQTQSPQTKPFIDPLVVMPLARPVRSLTPAPTEQPNVAAGEIRSGAFQAPLIDSKRFPVVPRTLTTSLRGSSRLGRRVIQRCRHRPSGDLMTAPVRAAPGRPIWPSTGTRSLLATTMRCLRSRRSTTPALECLR